jgi:NAD(P)H-dependent FMN reductase
MKKLSLLALHQAKKSINKQLATYAAGQFKNASVEVLDLNDYEMPIYSMDKEAKWASTISNRFYNKLGTADLLVIFCRT